MFYKRNIFDKTKRLKLYFILRVLYYGNVGWNRKEPTTGRKGWITVTGK